VINAGIDDTVCAGNNVVLNAAGPAGTTYTWNPGNMPGGPQTFPAVATTTYTLSGVDVNGCTGSDSVLVTVPAAIVLNAGGFPATCFGVCDGQVVVLATPTIGPFAQYTYLWATGGLYYAKRQCCLCRNLYCYRNQQRRLYSNCKCNRYRTNRCYCKLKCNYTNNM